MELPRSSTGRPRRVPPVFLRGLMVAVAIVIGFAAPLPTRAAERVSLSAAISLKPALVELAGEIERQTGAKPAMNFGASGVLLGQIKAGAPVDVFVSAAPRQIDDLFAAGLGVEGTRTVVARGRLVLIVPAANRPDRGIASLVDLASDKVKRLTIGQPATVPAGQYASQVLAKTNLSDKVADKLVLAANVRQALDYVARGEVDAGIVYATDACSAGDTVQVVETIDESLHDPVLYVAATVKDSPNPTAAARLLAFLKSPPAQQVLARHGFGPAEPPVIGAPLEAGASATQPVTAPAK
jgi:molybdate transport system substrate-binding protein